MGTLWWGGGFILCSYVFSWDIHIESNWIRVNSVEFIHTAYIVNSCNVRIPFKSGFKNSTEFPLDDIINK